MPNVLHPHISTSGKKEPMNWYEEKTQHVGCQSDTDKENRESQALVLE